MTLIGAAPAELNKTDLLRTEIPGPESRRLHEARVNVVPSGVSWVLPVYIDSAQGALLTDVDGNQFIDLGSGIGVTTIGHGDPAVVAAATEQLQKVVHTLYTVTPYRGYADLAAQLDAKTPGTHQKKTMFVNSGAEAVENAVKIARKYTGRRAVAVLDHAFHGRTMLTMAMNHKSAPYGTGFGPFAGDVHRVPNSYPYRDELDGAQAAARTIAYLEQRIGVSDLAAVIAEPIQGEGGFIVPAEGYLNILQRWATENGVVFVADEIQSGIARTGRWFASEWFGLVPDLVLTAKGIAGGLPLAGITGRAEIMDAAQPGGLGGTFGGNPVAIAAALAVFKQIEEDNLLAEADQIGQTLVSLLTDLQLAHPEIGEVRGRGAMVAFELVEAGTKTPLAGAAQKIAEYAAQQGVLVLTAGSYNNVVRFLPTLRTDDRLLRYSISVIDEALTGLRD